jgi:hypothetical protein
MYIYIYIYCIEKLSLLRQGTVLRLAGFNAEGNASPALSQEWRRYKIAGQLPEVRGGEWWGMNLNFSGRKCKFVGFII